MSLTKHTLMEQLFLSVLTWPCSSFSLPDGLSTSLAPAVSSMLLTPDLNFQTKTPSQDSCLLSSMPISSSWCLRSISNPKHSKFPFNLSFFNSLFLVVIAKSSGCKKLWIIKVFLVARFFLCPAAESALLCIVYSNSQHVLCVVSLFPNTVPSPF